MALTITPIVYHDTNIFPPILLDGQFGISELKVDKFQQCNETKHMHFIITLDQSGSMYETCNDGKTKMEYLLFTIEHMLRILHQTRNIHIAITIIAFDDIVNTVFETQNLHLEDVEQVIHIVKTITPGGSTNIGLALDTVYTKIEHIVTTQSNVNIVHLFLTDGEITMGITDIEQLKMKMHPLCENVCIGYGQSHDAHLLNQLVSLKHGQYRFIDAIENAGLVYGEVLHDTLYKMYVDVKVECINGSLYNYANNTWQSEIVYDSLSSEQTKTLYVKTSEPENCGLRVTCNTNIDIILEPNAITYSNLTHHIYRQATLALLYRGSKYEHKPFVFDDFSIDDMWNPFDADYLALQTELQTMLDKIMEYVETNHLESDLFLKTLMDDLFICIRTLGTRKGHMFTIARQTAQGREQTYTCSSIEEYVEDDMHFDFNDLLNSPTNTRHAHTYTLSTDTHLTPYKTRGVLNMMSQLSQTNTEELY